MEPVPPIRSPYLTSREAAAYCRIAVYTLYRHRFEIRTLAAGGKLLFRTEDLDAWLEGKVRRDGKVFRGGALRAPKT